MTSARINPARLRTVASSLARRLGVRTSEVERSIRSVVDHDPKADESDESQDPTPAAPQPARKQPVRWVPPQDRPHSYVRVPFMSRAEHGQPLQRALAYA